MDNTRRKADRCCGKIISHLIYIMYLHNGRLCKINSQYLIKMSWKNPTVKMLITCMQFKTMLAGKRQHLRFHWALGLIKFINTWSVVYIHIRQLKPTQGNWDSWLCIALYNSINLPKILYASFPLLHIPSTEDLHSCIVHVLLWKSGFCKLSVNCLVLWNNFEQELVRGLKSRLKRFN